MNKSSALRSVFAIVIRILKVLGFLAGGFLLYRNRKRLSEFFSRQTFFISALYAAIIALLALFYRLFTVLNWILQQGR
jgi:hypothetical protein